uniref:Zinc knuckle CX2CX4HX4C domain-containing protein n=1 Tax=Quercus lobata TaxID=97700 RepID=A0A7N2MYN9_QUELO
MISPEGDKLWVAFKYKRIVGLCYSCGRLGQKMKTSPIYHSSFTSDTEAVNLPYGDWLKVGGRHQVDEPRANESSQAEGHECGGDGTSSRSSPNLGNPNRLTGTTDTSTRYAADIVDEIG